VAAAPARVDASAGVDAGAGVGAAGVDPPRVAGHVALARVEARVGRRRVDHAGVEARVRHRHVVDRHRVDRDRRHVLVVGADALRRGVDHRLDRAQVRDDGARLGVGHRREARHRRAQRGALVVDALADRADDLIVGPPAEAGVGVGGEVGAEGGRALDGVVAAAERAERAGVAARARVVGDRRGALLELPAGLVFGAPRRRRDAERAEEGEERQPSRHGRRLYSPSSRPATRGAAAASLTRPAPKRVTTCQRPTLRGAEFPRNPRLVRAL
jgi:hypothetical protein